MKATANNIWQVPAYLPYLQPPLTESAIASAEKQLGYKLPSEYLELLKKQNGGYIRYTLPQTVHSVVAGIGPNYPSLTDFDWEESQEYVSFPLNGLVPFDGDGHWYLCLDYRKKKINPSVTYIDIECDSESPVAPSFAEYLAKLQIDADAEYVIEGSEIDDLKSKLATQLGITFEPPDTWAHGYPVHRAQLGMNKKIPILIWISPNTVSRGFVRTEDNRYAELKDLLPGFAPRFPEAPPNACLLTAAEEARTKVLDACAQCGLTVRPLRDYLQSSLGFVSPNPFTRNPGGINGK